MRYLRDMNVVARHRIFYCVLFLVLPMSTPHAQVNLCSVSMTNITFSDVDFVSGVVPTASGTLSYSCTNVGVVPMNIKLCFNIDGGSYAQSNYTPRLMSNGSQTLSFQLYQQDGITVWGYDGSAQSTPITLQATVGPLGTASGSIPITGRLVAGQLTVPTGAYTTTFPLPHSSYSILSTNLLLPGCPGIPLLNGSFNFTVSATVIKACTVTASNLNFGTVDRITNPGNIDAQSSVNVTCTYNTPYTVGLTPSNNASNGSGVMNPTGGIPSNSDTVPYGLYRDAARSNQWGNQTGTNTVAGTGGGSSQQITVYGRVPNINYRPDSYLDTVTVRVNY